MLKKLSTECSLCTTLALKLAYDIPLRGGIALCGVGCMSLITLRISVFNFGIVCGLSTIAAPQKEIAWHATFTDRYHASYSNDKKVG